MCCKRYSKNLQFIKPIPGSDLLVSWGRATARYTFLYKDFGILESIATFAKPNGRFMLNSREHILNTAVQLFLQKSYHEVTMQDIVTASGMSKGAFYHYFTSKENLFEEVINHFFLNANQNDYRQFSQQSLRAFYQDYVQRVIDQVNHYNEKTGDTSGLLRANQLMLISDATKMFPHFREAQQRRQQEELTAWIAIIDKARRSGEITTTLDNERIAKLFVYLNYGIGVYHLLRTQLEELTLELNRQFEALYHSLKA